MGGAEAGHGGAGGQVGGVGGWVLIAGFCWARGWVGGSLLRVPSLPGCPLRELELGNTTHFAAAGKKVGTQLDFKRSCCSKIPPLAVQNTQYVTHSHPLI